MQFLDYQLIMFFEKASLFKARGLCNPGKVRHRVFEMTSQTHTLITEPP